MRPEVKFEVIGGCCEIAFRPGSSCGPSPDCNPGVSFDFISGSPKLVSRGGKHHGGMGVFSRTDAKRLVDALNEFLAEHPPVPA